RAVVHHAHFQARDRCFARPRNRARTPGCGAAQIALLGWLGPHASTSVGNESGNADRDYLRPIQSDGSLNDHLLDDHMALAASAWCSQGGHLGRSIQAAPDTNRSAKAADLPRLAG